jgi:hypothetical protein
MHSENNLKQKSVNPIRHQRNANKHITENFPKHFSEFAMSCIYTKHLKAVTVRFLISDKHLKLIFVTKLHLLLNNNLIFLNNKWHYIKDLVIRCTVIINFNSLF